MIRMGPKAKKAWDDFTKTGNPKDYLNFTNVREMESGRVDTAAVIKNSEFGVRNRGEGVQSTEFGVMRD